MKQQVRHQIVEANDVGQRLDNYLIRQLKGVPKSRIYKIVRKGELRVNGKRAAAHYKLQAGDKLRIPPVTVQKQAEVRPPDAYLSRIQSSIIYEDEALIILNKPAGMAVHKGTGLHYGITEGLSWLDERYQTVSLVHRLDRETSGCLLLARSRETLRELHRQFREGEVTKHYRALVYGYFPQAREINAPLKKQDARQGQARVVASPDGQPAVTRFNPMRWFNDATFVDVQLLTGRMHQIRVHAHFAGHPIAGDGIYGDGSFNQKLKGHGLKRLFLHASNIGFYHPTKGEWIAAVAPMEVALIDFLEQYS